jgi:hypothetical protein
VILEAPLREHLQRRYRPLPAAAIEQAVLAISYPQGATLDRRDAGQHPTARLDRLRQRPAAGRLRAKRPLGRVRRRRRRAVAALENGGDSRVGVVWHTQGSGKSLSMIFLTGILRRWPGLNPTVVVRVDRSDLDYRLYENYVAARDLVGSVRQANDVDDLRDALQNAGGEVICSTIEKFRLQAGELRHPVLSERRNILVIADEAHCTQYNLVACSTVARVGTGRRPVNLLGCKPDYRKMNDQSLGKKVLPPIGPLLVDAVINGARTRGL